MEEEAQLEQLHRVHAAAVRAYVRRRIGPDDADEVVADVFVVAWRRLADLPAEPRTWLLGIARRLLANRRRSAQRQRALYERLAHEAETGPPSAAGAGVDGSGGGALLRALAAIPDADREVLLLVTWDGLTHREAGEVLGVRDTTVAMRVHRARRRLARAIAAEERGAAPPAPASPRPRGLTTTTTDHAHTTGGC